MTRERPGERSERPPSPIDHPGAWKAADLGDLGVITFELEARHRRILERALRASRAHAGSVESITRDDFPLEDMADDVERIRDRVQNGHGIVLLRGLPVARYSREDVCRLFWGLGTHFGNAVSQSLMGDRLGHVVDVSGEHPAERGYRSRRELDWHTDSDDFLMMLCLQQAKRGGESRFVSALTIYNEILAARPDLLPILFRGFRYHLRGEQAEGEEPITPFRVPVFSHREGATSCVYLRAFIDMAADDLGEPLDEEETTALDRFEATADRADLRLAISLKPGDAYIANNYTILHSRTAFEDHDAAERRRYFLRLWLKARAGRPVVDTVRRFYRHDGIEQREGGSTLYAHGQS
ncbi:MAG: TauD/TfdA family dioxygenase [Gammaproteobacteria bacterium]|nr:TauD/TfdA family dioxygenase [Gammaproteobacteria bacterium]